MGGLKDFVTKLNKRTGRVKLSIKINSCKLKKTGKKIVDENIRDMRSSDYGVHCFG